MSLILHNERGQQVHEDYFRDFFNNKKTSCGEKMGPFGPKNIALS